MRSMQNCCTQNRRFGKAKRQMFFSEIDVDENEDITQEYDISVMRIKNGNKLYAFSGANFDKLRETCTAQ